MGGWPWTAVQTHCFIPDSSTSFSLLYGAGEMVSRGCRQSLKVSHCHLFLLTLLSCSCVGFHELQSFTINLLQCGSFPQSFRINLIQIGLSIGYNSFREYPPTLAWSPAVLISAITRVLSTGCKKIPAPSQSSPWPQGNNLIHHYPLHFLQVNICSGAWCTFFPFFLQTLEFAGLFLMHACIISFFFPCHFCPF